MLYLGVVMNLSHIMLSVGKRFASGLHLYIVIHRKSRKYHLVPVEIHDPIHHHNIGQRILFQPLEDTIDTGFLTLWESCMAPNLAHPC